MRQLPQRPNLDQLRRQARELQRASKSLTLTAAQLSVARDYGFPSWARLKAEVERRRRPHPALPQRGRESVEVRSWQAMRESSADLLQRRTGRNVDAWNRRIAQRPFRNPAALRQWLTDEGVTGYAQQLLVWERFGYPSFMTAGADDLIGRQYLDRAQLRPILDATLAALPGIGSVAVVQARKTYVSLVSRRRTFAVVQATTRNRWTSAYGSASSGPAGGSNPERAWATAA